MFNLARMTVLIGFLITFSCMAHAIVIQKAGKGYIFVVETATGKHCWHMPQHLDLSFIPDKPMDVEAAAKKFKWKKPSGAQLGACKAIMQIVWKVYSNQHQATQPVYKIDANKYKIHNIVTDKVIDAVKTNTVCGGYVNNYGISNDLSWRLVTGKAGKRGAALCKEH